jgi:hypothetical protein
MDSSNAQMPAFLRFHRFHEDLNRRLKIGVIGLGVLADSLASKAHNFDSIKDLCYSRGDLWGGMPDWTDPQATIEEAKNDLGAAGVLRAFSAFDVFLEQLGGEIQVYTERNKRTRPSTPGTTSEAQVAVEADDEDPKIKLSRFYSRYRWDQQAILDVLPLYTYFRLMRNCLAHADGQVKPALAEASTSAEVAAAELSWKRRYRGKSEPASRTQIGGKKLDIRHRDAILASSVLRDIADDLNRKAVSLLNGDGLVYLAAHRAIRDSAPHGLPGVTPYSLLTGYLTTLRMKVNLSEVAESLDRTNLRKKFLANQQSFVAGLPAGAPGPRSAAARSAAGAGLSGRSETRKKRRT